jgi:hypothetical protein
MEKIIAFAELDIRYNAGAIANDIHAISSSWSPHFNKRHYSGKWEILSLRSVDGKPETIIPHVTTTVTYYDTPLMDHCPAIKQLISGFSCDIMSVRLMNLPAGSIIKQHTDPELSFEQGEARFHFPVVTNDQVDFRVENKRVIMPMGSSWYINANLPHSVSNLGISDRIHLVVDCRVNQWVQQLFSVSQKYYADSIKIRQRYLQIIESLKLQGTDVAMQLAGKMEKELNENE